jgi:hypothetical protein
MTRILLLFCVISLLIFILYGDEILKKLPNRTKNNFTNNSNPQQLIENFLTERFSDLKFEENIKIYKKDDRIYIEPFLVKLNNKLHHIHLRFYEKFNNLNSFDNIMNINGFLAIDNIKEIKIEKDNIFLENKETFQEESPVNTTATEQLIDQYF